MRTPCCRLALTLSVACLALAALPPVAHAEGAMAMVIPTPEAATRPLSWRDKRYMIDLASGYLAQIAVGRKAQAQSGSGEVKTFARNLADNYAEELDLLHALAFARNLKLPTQADERQQKLVRHLDDLSGAALDREYLLKAGAAQKDLLKLVKKVAQSARDDDLRDIADKAEPVVEAHAAKFIDLKKRYR